MQLRDATNDDIEYARVIHHSAYKDVLLSQFGSWDEDLQISFFKDAWDSHRHSILLKNGIRYGYVAVSETHEEILIDELVIEPQFQGRGIGSAFLQAMICKAQRLKIPIRLQALKKNRAAKLYEKLGFVRYGETEHHFKFEYTPAAA